MNPINKIFTLITIWLISIQKATTQNTTSCTMSGDWCSFTNIITSDKNPLFFPSYDDPLVVTRIAFASSRIPILTNEICSAFSNLREFYVVGANLERITKEALQMCMNLVLFDIYGNFVTELDNDLFLNNPEVNRINLGGNRLRSIDVRLFQHTLKLEFLILENNLLVEFDVKNIVKLVALKEVQLNWNHLLRLNANDVLGKFSNLQRMYIDYNLFLCDELSRMIETFEGKRIEMISGKGPQELLYNTRKVKDIDCLDKKEYLEVVFDKIKKLKGSNDANFLLDIVETELEPKSNQGVVIVQFITTALMIVCTFIVCYHGFFWHQTVDQVINSDQGDYYYSYQPGMDKE